MTIDDGMDRTQVAAMFGVRDATIGSIMRGDSWRHVQ